MASTALVAPTQTAERALERIDAPCTAFGLVPPPCTVHVWFMGDRLLAIIPPGRARLVVDWLQGMGIEDIDLEPGLSPRSMWFSGRAMPDSWPLHDDVGQRRLELTAEGTATLFAEEGRPVDGLARDLAAQWPGIHRRPVAPTQLTPRQGEALTLAAAMGYYEVPRRVSLRVLACKMGLSQGAASELLRRAERALIMGFCDTWGERDGVA